MSSNPSVKRPSTSRTLRLAMKELREILRDRRTVLTLVLMPFLVYPLLGVIMRKGMMSGVSLSPTVDVVICFETEAEGAAFEFEMASGKTILQSRGELPPDDAQDHIGLPTGKQRVRFKPFVLREDSTLEKAVTEGSVDLAIRISASMPPEEAGTAPRPFRKWEFFRSEGSALGARGLEEIVSRLDAVNENYTELLLERNGLSSQVPQQIVDQQLEAEGRSVPALITFIPLVLVLMTMTGAVYPAIDLTAGERERGTMEILVAAPVSRMTLLAGKFVAVLVVSLLTAAINLISMFATLFALGMERTILGNVGLTVVFQVVVLLMVFAAFFSAVLLSITSIARSFKEAQAYLVPLMLISLTPGVFSLMPDIEIGGILAVTPLVNTVLMARDLLIGDVNLLVFAIVLISTAIYGVLALSLAARIFGSDAVLYGSGGSWSELFRRPEQKTTAASVQVTMACLAVVFSLFIVFGSVPSRLDVSLKGQLLAAGVTSVLLFVAVPLAIATVARVKIQSGFALLKPHSWSWVAAGLLGCSLWPFIYEIEIAMLSEARVEDLKALYESFELNLKNVPLWVKLLSLAVAPAVCEEFFFRGFLQNSIRRYASAPLAILAAGVLFGLFHVIVKDALFFERMVPSTLMGIILGILFERSGSVFPGMLLHVVHNGLLVTVSEYEESLANWGIGISDHQHLPLSCLMVAGLTVCCAALLLVKRFSVPDPIEQTPLP